MEPRIHHFRGGWAVSGEDFAIFASTREEALRQYHLHQSHRCGIPGCENDAAALLEGVALCLVHRGRVSIEPEHREYVRPPSGVRRTS